MKFRKMVFVAVALVFFVGSVTTVDAQEKQVITSGGESVEVPQPNVPEVFTLTGQFVRIAYNNEGWVTLGYRTANSSQGDDWMLLEVGTTVRKPTKGQTIKREAFSVTLPDESTVAMATQPEFSKAGSLRALNQRADTVRDSINYFPAEANQACRIGFFADVTQADGTVAFDEYSLNFQRGCLGRLFFQIPGGITTGQYFLNVKFENSMVRVPFRILTKDEEKYFKKNWKDIKKQHEDFLKQEAAKAKQTAADQQKK